MGTPIYDELISRARSGHPEQPGTPQLGAEPAASCAWCGTPVWGDDAAVEFEADDSETGDPVTMTVCSAEHRAALQAHRAGAGHAHP